MAVMTASERVGAWRAAEVTGVTYKRIDEWVHASLLTPTYTPTGKRRFELGDLVLTVVLDTFATGFGAGKDQLGTLVTAIREADIDPAADVFTTSLFIGPWATVQRGESPSNFGASTPRLATTINGPQIAAGLLLKLKDSRPNLHAP